jgi:iron complex transport system ATP-binding protein
MRSPEPVGPVLRLVDAVVVKNGVRVLDGLTMTIRAGEHTAILGPNGAGKTSLINLLTYQDRALAREDGEAPVQVFGESRWDLFDLRARLGIVSADLHQRFVNGNSEGAIKGLDAVVSGLLATYGIVRYAKVTEAMRERAAEALARIGASHLSNKPMNEMSTGEARRVLIARALVTTPLALVLDEPTAGLDMLARRRFLEHVSAVARQGTTIILVTHHVEDIIPEVERVLLLARGRVVVEGAKAEVLTEANLSALFEAPISLAASGAYYHARV